MGSDHLKVRYLIFKGGHYVWRPSKAMRAAGFRPVHFGAGYVVEDVRYPDAADIKRAMDLNAQWDRHRRGLPPLAPRSRYPARSIGEGYERAMKLREAERKARGVEWTSEQHSRDDWPRAWKWIESLFGDIDPKTVQPEQLIDPDLPGLRPLVAAKVSEVEAHRTIKVWRALWQRMAALGYCDKDRDPASNSRTPHRSRAKPFGARARRSGSSNRLGAMATTVWPRCWPSPGIRNSRPSMLENSRRTSGAATL
jgi:hypothetical protein